ncbi:MAG: S9 family peptidase [bacterium]|nr:S9 family peptidase [bacterium]
MLRLQLLAGLSLVPFASVQDVGPGVIASKAPVTTAEVERQDVAAQVAAGEEAQEPSSASGPRVAGPADWRKWERLGTTRLSPDGRWLAYELRREDGTRELHARLLASDAVESFPEGTRPVFSGDSKWLAFAIGHSEEEREKLTEEKKTAENQLGLYDLVKGDKLEIERVSRFAFSESGANLAMLHYGAKDDEHGADLVVRDLATGIDTHFGRTDAFEWSEVGELLAMTIDSPDEAGNGVRVWEAATQRLVTLDSSASAYHRLTWREDAADLAVLREKAFEEDEDTTHAVLAWRGLDGATPRATTYDPLQEEAFPDDRRLVDFAGVTWSDDGSALFFGLKSWDTRPAELDATEETEEGEQAPEESSPERDEEKNKKGSDDEGDEDDSDERSMRETLDDPPGVEVWHASDIDVLPRQKKTADRDAKESWLACLWLDAEDLVVLEDELVEDVDLLDGQRWALGRDETPYEEEQRFSATLVDLYAVDVASGERKKILERVRWHFTGDPLGRQILFVRDDHIWSYDLETGGKTSLTEGMVTRFINQENSSLTNEKPPYGISAWMKDGKHVVLADRYDLWCFALDGSGAKRLTEGAQERIRHRRIVLDEDEDEFVDPARGFYVSLWGDTSKKSGYGQFTFGRPVEQLVWKDARIRRLARAEEADVFVYSEERYDDSPDLFVAGPALDGAEQVTETNPFHSDYLWGRSELVDYESADGTPLQGALFYPAGWEPGKRYPMVVYIYELRSQVLHDYETPSERNPYNASVFTSQGYFVFQPDIVYRAQNPGLSAVECVVPAVREVLRKDMVDEDRIGLVGHSWGAYQTAFVVTQTDLFAAGVAGAPLTNMMSMSMSMYWNSGQTDAYIFHESQGRMDRPFWRDIDTYIANSPIFNIERLNTPLLMTFGDKDGAVDWHQGIEMYNAARLAQRPLVMLVYPGENHGLRKKPNQVDYHHRVLEWFRHYLDDEEAPEWIVRGQTWLEREKELKEFKKTRGKKNGKKGKNGDRDAPE